MADKDARQLAVEFEKIAREATALPSDRVMKALGFEAITIISLRTKAGLDADLQAFAPYSKKYIPFRQRKTLRTSPPDLVVTGQMLGAMIPEVIGRGEVEIQFQTPEQARKAALHSQGTIQDGGDLPQRDFFDVRNPDEVKVIEESLADKLAAILGADK